MRVLFADDHEAIHFLAAHLVPKAFPGAAELRSVTNTADLLAALDREPVDLVVLDLVMPGPVKRIGLVRAVRDHPSKPKILVYSSETHPLLTTAILTAGASGYVPKGAPVTSLLLAMRTVAQGERYVDEAMATAAHDHPWQQLSTAEREVLRFIAGGKTIKQIASDTNRAYSTIASLRTHGLEKLGLRCQEELSAYYYQEGLDFELDAGFQTTAPCKAPAICSDSDAAPLAAANVFPLYPGNLSASDLEVCETIALVMLQMEPEDARKCMRVTSLSFESLDLTYGTPDAMSNAWRFPIRRWSHNGRRIVAIDVGRQRVYYEMERSSLRQRAGESPREPSSIY